MSEENAEIVRRAIAAWNDGDVEAMISFMTPDIEIRLTGMFSGLDRKLRGHDGFRAVWNELKGTFDQLLIEINETHPSGDLVFVGTTFQGRGRDDIAVERPFYFVFRFRDHLVARYESFAEREPALEAAGLSE
jgi:ketosteroid isomerase-like protein